MNKASHFFLKQDGNNGFKLDQKKIDKSSEYDGFVCISTNLKNIKVEEILSRYKDLYQIEHSFRTFKSYLETRPMFHWTDKRIRGHLCLCYLSYGLLMGLENRLKKKRHIMSEQAIRSALNSMQVSLVKSKSDLFYMGAPLQATAKKLLKVMGLKPAPVFAPKNHFERSINN